MRASPALIDYLKRREEFRAVAYLDAAGIWTIGYGHVIRPYEKKTLYAMTEPQACDLLDRDCDPAELYIRAISPSFKIQLNQHQFDGLVTLAFNIGLRAFEESTLLKLVRAGDFAGAAAEFYAFIYITKTGGHRSISRALADRRLLDRALFERGVYAG